jgi:aryl-alcohol dehydrogenase-like predicted oxidoreductase
LRQAVIREDRRPRPPRLFTPDAARRSLEASLLALRSDYVDIFFLHEPTCEGDISGDLYGCMEQLKSEGKIRAYGLSCMARDVMPIVAAYPNLAPVLQFDNDACSRQIDLLTPPPGADILTFSPFSTALPVLEDLCARQQAFVRRIFSETGVDLENRKSRLALLLAYALHTNPGGPVVFASTSPAHIAEIVRCVGESLPEKQRVDEVVEKLATAINGPAALVG